MNFKEGYEDVHWVQLAHDTAQCRALVNKVTSLYLDSIKCKNFLTACVTINFSRTLVHGVTLLLGVAGPSLLNRDGIK
jgi:hypothetical protein